MAEEFAANRVSGFFSSLELMELAGMMETIEPESTKNFWLVL